MQPFNLKKEVSETTADIDSDDVINVKKHLKNFGYYKEPEWGIDAIVDTKMFDGIRSFQKDKNLKIDGVMKPKGETESMFNKILKKGEYGATGGLQGLSFGWADEAEGAIGGVGYALGSLNPKWNKQKESMSEAFERGYKKYRDNRRSVLEEGYKKAPILTGGMEVAGAISSPIKFSKTRASSPAQKLARKNLLDAVGSGITYGVGSASGSSDYADSTAKSITGALLGHKVVKSLHGARGGTPLVRGLMDEGVGKGVDKVWDEVFSKKDKNK